MGESTLTNRKFVESDRKFKVACNLAGIPLTKRQASKFRRGIGSAHAAVRSFIDSGYAARRDSLQVELAGIREKLEAIQTEGGEEVFDDIEALEGHVKILEAKLAGLKADYETLRA